MANGASAGPAIHIDTFIDGDPWVTIETTGKVTMRSAEARAWAVEVLAAATHVEDDSLLYQQMLDHDVAQPKAAGWIRHLRDVRQNGTDSNPGRS